MCDTIIATGKATADGITLFGKNSDREPNEAQYIQRIPRTKHGPGGLVKCTYIEIPQAEETYEVVLSRPFWLWGAEMGTNEFGVTIGNESVFSKIPAQKEPALLGMDLIRLGLERAKTAREALDVITSLLEQYGQGGNGGYTKQFPYHNSFIIADPQDAWVLETVAEHWAAQQVTGIRTISNGLTIGSEFDLASGDLVTYAIDRGWCKNRDDFSFARCYSDFIYTTFGLAHQRHSCTTDFLRGHEGKITVATMMQALRTHGPDQKAASSGWEPVPGITNRQICQHAGWGPIRGDQTTASMVSYLAPDTQTHFLTGTAAPCTSLFKPVWLGADLPDLGSVPAGVYDESTLYWRHEALHRAVIQNYARNLSLYEEERDAIEARFVEEALALHNAPVDDRAAFSAKCFSEADDAEKRWLSELQRQNTSPRRNILFNAAWHKHNTQAKIPDR